MKFSNVIANNYIAAALPLTALRLSLSRARAMTA